MLIISDPLRETLAGYIRRNTGSLFIWCNTKILSHITSFISAGVVSALEKGRDDFSQQSKRGRNLALPGPTSGCDLRLLQTHSEILIHEFRNVKEGRRVE